MSHYKQAILDPQSSLNRVITYTRLYTLPAPLSPWLCSTLMDDIFTFDNRRRSHLIIRHNVMGNQGRILITTTQRRAQEWNRYSPIQYEI